MKQVPTIALNNKMTPTVPKSVEYQEGSSTTNAGNKKSEMINRVIRSDLFWLVRKSFIVLCLNFVRLVTCADVREFASRLLKDSYRRRLEPNELEDEQHQPRFERAWIKPEPTNASLRLGGGANLPTCRKKSCSSARASSEKRSSSPSNV